MQSSPRDQRRNAMIPDDVESLIKCRDRSRYLSWVACPMRKKHRSNESDSQEGLGAKPMAREEVTQGRDVALAALLQNNSKQLNNLEHEEPDRGKSLFMHSMHGRPAKKRKHGALSDEDDCNDLSLTASDILHPSEMRLGEEDIEGQVAKTYDTFPMQARYPVSCRAVGADT